MIHTGKHLPRRAFLRQAGTVVALPFLDAMVPAFGATPAPVHRLAITYVPNGIVMENWTPSSTGLEFTPILEPLKSFRDNLILITGLASKPAFPGPGEGTGDHVRAASTFLTGAHPKKTEGPDIRAGVSMDQIAAQELSKDVQLGSLEVCLDSNELIGACEAGYSCAYANTLSWRNATTPLPMENQPRAVFERLFGDNDNTTDQARLARIREDRSILDSLSQEVTRLGRNLGQGDRSKLEQYLDSIREIERRIQKAEEQSSLELPRLERPSGGIPSTFAEHARLMFDLLVLAHQSGITRVSTFLMSREVSPRPYPEIGIPDPHHGLSHHQHDPARLAKLTRINTHHMEQYGYFLEKLRATPDGDGSLLDHMTLLYGCGISDSNDHLHTNLPILVAGGGAGRLKGGRHVRVPEQTPLANLHLALLEKLGVPIDSLGDSTAPLGI
jgi:hypothetical protein